MTEMCCSAYSSENVLVIVNGLYEMTALRIVLQYSSIKGNWAIRAIEGQNYSASCSGIILVSLLQYITYKWQSIERYRHGLDIDSR